MPKLAYGVWDGRVYDSRRGGALGAPDLDLSVFDNFSSGNPARIFISHRGFLVFDEGAPLLWALARHFGRVARESCGKCTPCRAGAPLILEELAKICSGQPADAARLRALAEQMQLSSLCGIGQTGPQPLLDALDHFPDELQAGAAEEATFFSTVTSPCIEACPGLVNIPRYIDYIREGHSDLAAGVLLRHYPLVGSCGRVCVRSCESACRRSRIDDAVSIRGLKRFAADAALATGLLRPEAVPLEKKRSVAVIGAGPVGVSCAYHLLESGYPVEIYEARQEAGGMIRYGIPVYRLPKDLLANELDLVRKLGGRIHYGQKLGRDFSIDDLFERGHAAIFISAGCPQGSYLGMKDEDTSLADYENGIDFLDRVYEGVAAGQPPRLAGDVVVVGGGNVAMDCCRAAARLADGRVHVIYRRTEADAPADREEIEAARAEGVEFHFLCGQDAIISENGRITGLRVCDMERTEPDASGRRGVRPIPGSEHVIPCRHVIAAIGQHPDPQLLTEADGIMRDRKNCVTINGACETSRKGVFAAGDCTSGPRASGPSTMIMGMGHAWFAARAIDRYLSGQETFDPRWRMSEWIGACSLLADDRTWPRPQRRRVAPRELEAGERLRGFAEVEQTMSQDDAWREASRCLRCYRVLSVLAAKPIPGAAGPGQSASGDNS